MIRNIVFDMGMVLLDFHPMDACRAVAPDDESAQKLITALFNNPEWVRLDDGSLEEDELIRRAMARLDDARLRPLISKIMQAMPFNVLSPLPGMEGIVDFLHARGFRVYLLSNAGLNVSLNREIIPDIAKFDGVVFSVEEKVIKPNPVIYQRLTQRYGLVPQECLFIDDLAPNVAGARAQGWEAYQFSGDAPALRQMLAALPQP